MKFDLLVFDTHPVQYRGPVWRELSKRLDGRFSVFYANDSSVRGYLDTGFSQNIAWDTPILEGYESRFAAAGECAPTAFDRRVREAKPDVVLLVGVNSAAEIRALITCVRRNIPVFLRTETQDYAFPRHQVKSVARGLIYRLIYRCIAGFFYIGELNRLHYLGHGVSEKRLFPSRYCTVDSLASVANTEKDELRRRTREKRTISNDMLVIGFSGKFIPKKNPDILFEALQYLPSDLRSKVVLCFVGSGELESQLKESAVRAEKEYGVQSVFTGFVNQSAIGAHYLAMDIFVLPSRKAGETWGLVVNEALQAGCSICVTDAVGCSADFSALPRFRVFPVEDSQRLASYICELSKYQRDFDWARDVMQEYSVEAAATGIATGISKTLDFLRK